MILRNNVCRLPAISYYIMLQVGYNSLPKNNNDTRYDTYNNNGVPQKWLYLEIKCNPPCTVIMHVSVIERKHVRGSQAVQMKSSFILT